MPAHALSTALHHEPTPDLESRARGTGQRSARPPLPTGPGLLLALLLGLALGCTARPGAEGSQLSGAEIFAAKCSVCHSLPILESLFEQNRGRPPGFAYDALTEGNMRRVGSELDEAQRRAVAEFFSGVAFDSPEAKRDWEVSPRCAPEHARFDWSDRAHPSWGRSERNLRAVADDGGLGRQDLDRLAVEWVVAFPESSQLRSQPTAAGGALFVGSHNGSVYALDQATGCTRWHFKAATEVRSAITIDIEEGGETPPIVRAIFADRAANAYALDATTGRLLWKQSVDSHPNAAITGSVSAWAGRLFVPVSSNDDVNSLDPTFPCCTHHGAVVALDAKSGEILWSTPTVVETPRVSGHTPLGTEIWGPSGASVWNTPTIASELGLLFVGSGNNHSRPATSMSDSVLALDLETGRVVWTYQSQAGDAWNAACIFGNRSSCPDPEGPDIDFGATTMLASVDGRDLLFAGQKSGMLHALDPATGELVWKKRVARGGPEAGIRYGMATDDGTLFVPSHDQGEERIDGMAARPGLFAISARDGEMVWTADPQRLCAEGDECLAVMTAPPLVLPELVFAAALDGTLHAFDRRSGEPLWRFETAREFTTLRGRPTRGGGISGTAGPMVANGRLFVGSGYGQAQRPGNALIALAPR